jgi:hypothetical protein
MHINSYSNPFIKFKLKIIDTTLAMHGKAYS